MPADERPRGWSGPKAHHLALLALIALAALVIDFYARDPFHATDLDPRARLFGVIFYQMPSAEMQPTVEQESTFWVVAWPYLLKEPQRGDIVLFSRDSAGAPNELKRVIGVGGDVVSISRCMATVNGVQLDEGTYVATFKDPASRICNLAAVTVPANQYYVLGDSRENSSDSRAWGFVARDRIFGEMIELSVTR